MKNKALSFTYGVLLIILIPVIIPAIIILYMVYVIMDIFETKPEEPDYIPFPKTKSTVYPDDYISECTTEDFNKFYSDIHKQLN